MGNDNEYEFIPLTPITHDSLPEEMRDFISSCGMMGIMPRRSFVNPGHRILGQIIDLKTLEGGTEIDRSLEQDSKDVDNSMDFIRFRDVELEKHDASSDERVNRVLRNIEDNNSGVLKFLQANGMPYDKAKKFIKRIVRLSLRYGE